MTEIGLIGPGRVGRALAGLLPADKFRIGPVLSRSLTSARRAVREMECGAAADAPEALQTSDVILIAVPDKVVETVGKRLSKVQFSFAKKVVLHTSGIRDSSDLAPLRELGAAVGTLHPLYIFQRPVLSLAGIHFVVEGDPAAAQTARSLVRAWNGEFQLVKPNQKIYHSIALSMASDCLTGLIEAAVQQMTSGGFSRRRGLEAVSRLVAAAQEDYARSGRKSRPGPLLDGDAETIRLHLAALQRDDPQTARDYQMALRQSLNALRKNVDGLSFLYED